MKGLGVGVWTFGMGSERYVSDGYKPYLTLEERIAKVSTLKGISGIEVTFPNDVNADTAHKFRALINQYGLSLCGMGVELVCDKEWQSGSFASPDPRRREKAISLTRAAMDMAAEFGVSNVSLWLGQDGFDYVFQDDYAAAWQRLVEGVREAANHRSDVTLGLEYKTSEPKMACYVNRAVRPWRWRRQRARPMWVLLWTWATPSTRARIRRKLLPCCWPKSASSTSILTTITPGRMMICGGQRALFAVCGTALLVEELNYAGGCRWTFTRTVMIPLKPARRPFILFPKCKIWSTSRILTA